MAGREQQQPPRGHMRYPIMDIEQTGNGTAGRSSASPSNSSSDRAIPLDKSRYPPSHAEEKESLRFNKRPAGSPIGANVDKRPRINASSEPNRSNAASPDTSRQNSITATVGPNPARRSSAISSGDNIVHPSRDPRRQVKGSAGSASPMHAASPLSMTNGDVGQYGSGNTTPTHGAPPAPSMVPQKPRDVSGTPRGVLSLRLAAAQKQTRPAVGSENSTLASVYARSLTLQKEWSNTEGKLGQLQKELIAEKTRRNQLEERLQKLENKIDPSPNAAADAGLAKQVQQLLTKVQQLEARPSVGDRAEQGEQLDAAKLQSDLETCNSKVSNLETVCDSTEKRLDKALPEIQSDVETVKTDNAKLQSQVDDLRTKYVTQKAVIDKLATRVDNSHLDKLAEDLVSVNSKSDDEGKRIDNLTRDVELLRKDMGVVKEDNISEQVITLKSEFNSHQQEIKQQLKSITNQISTMPTPEQSETSEDKLVATVLESINPYVVERVQNEVSLHVEPRFKELKDITNSLSQKTTKDIRADIATINSATEETANIVADSNKTIADLRSNISSIEDSTNDLRLEFQELKTASSSDIRAIRRQLETASCPSGTSAHPQPSDAILVKRILDLVKEKYESRIVEAESNIEEAVKSADEAWTEAKVASTYIATLSDLKTKFSIFENSLSGVPEAVAAIQVDYQTLRTQALSQDYGEAINNIRLNVDKRLSAFNDSLGRLEHIFGGLEQRYQNISTDYLQQSMVHWITQTYPNAPDFLNKLLPLEEAVTNIGKFVNRIGWMQEYTEQLFSLAHNFDEFDRLRRDTVTSGQLSAQELAVLRNKIEDTQARIQGLEALPTELANERTGRITLATKIQDVSDYSNRELSHTKNRLSNAEFAIQSHGHTLQTQEQSINRTDSTIKQQNQKIEALQPLIDTLNINVPVVMLALKEVQQAILDVNKQLQGDSLTLHFSHNFSTPPKA